MVTRAREQASRLVEIIEQLGGQAIECPMIRIVPLEPEENTHILQVIQQIGTYQWIVFTSINGVRAFGEKLRELRMDIRCLAGIKLAAIGEVTRDELWKLGLKADRVPENYTTAGLLEELRQAVIPGERVLLLRADIAPPDLEISLQEAGIDCQAVPAYQTRTDGHLTAELIEQLEEGTIDVLTFTSSSTVRNFCAQLPPESIAKLKTKIICIGPVTAAAAREYGLPVTAVARVHTIDGLVTEILESIQD